jgi:hypothetical protein
MLMPKTQRQDDLLASYEFNCDCTACANNYPMPNKLKRNDKNFVLPKFGKFPSNENLLKELQDNFKYINDNIDIHPSFETAAVLIRIKELIRTVCERVAFLFSDKKKLFELNKVKTAVSIFCLSSSNIVVKINIFLIF